MRPPEYYTLSPRTVIRSDPQYRVKYLAFQTDTQEQAELNSAGFLALQLLERNWLTPTKLASLVVRDADGAEMERITGFLEGMKRAGFVVSSDTPGALPPVVESPHVEVGRQWPVPVASSPYDVEVHLTRGCNLRCLHCAYDARRALAQELPARVWMELIDELERLRILRLQVSGGEPTLAKEFEALAAHLAHKRMHVDLLTNGTRLTSSLCQHLAAPNFDTVISLDGARPETHDWFRGVRCFDRIIDGLRRLKSAGARFHIATVVHRQNLGELEDAVDLAETLGAGSISFILIEAVGRAVGARGSLLSPDERQQARLQITRLVRERQESIEIAFLDPSVPQYRDLETVQSQRHVWCSAGVIRAAVRSDGWVYPCVYAFRNRRFAVGRVATREGKKAARSFETAWANGGWELFRGGVSIDDLQTCRSCELRQSCSLKVCRLKAWESTGDFLGVPPSCQAAVHSYNSAAGRR